MQLSRCVALLWMLSSSAAALKCLTDGTGSNLKECPVGELCGTTLKIVEAPRQNGLFCHSCTKNPTSQKMNCLIFLQCVGNQDRCFTYKENKTAISSGCMSANLCDDPKKVFPFFQKELECCSGSLCSSAATFRPSVAVSPLLGLTALLLFYNL